jgi:hypothetical protein
VKVFDNVNLKDSTIINMGKLLQAGMDPKVLLDYGDKFWGGAGAAPDRASFETMVEGLTAISAFKAEGGKASIVAGDGAASLAVILTPSADGKRPAMSPQALVGLAKVSPKNFSDNVGKIMDMAGATPNIIPAVSALVTQKTPINPTAFLTNVGTIMPQVAQTNNGTGRLNTALGNIKDGNVGAAMTRFTQAATLMKNLTEARGPKFDEAMRLIGTIPEPPKPR